jgi:hypothetical protein
VWKGMDSAKVSYCCGKLIFGQTILSLELSVAINAQVEAPGHGKWWLDGKTGSDKHYFQQCMHSIITQEAVDSGKHMPSAKWIDCSGVLVAVSPATECVCMLSSTARTNGIKSKGMWASCEGNALVERNNYEWYTMDDVPFIPNYKIVFPKGKFNGIRAYYNIRTDPDLGLGYAALWRIACGCNACKEQLGSKSQRALKSPDRLRLSLLLYQPLCCQMPELYPTAKVYSWSYALWWFSFLCILPLGQ